MCFYAYCGQNTSIKYTVKRYLVGPNDLTKRFLNGHTFCVANQVRCIFLRPSDNYSAVPIKRSATLSFFAQFADRYFPFLGATFIEFLEISFREISLFHT